MENNSPKPANSFIRRRRTERLLALAALLLMVVVWVLGALRAEASLMPAVQQAIPDAGYFERKADGFYEAYSDESKQELLGYVAIGEADGYGGPLTLAVGVDSNGQVLGAVIADHKETSAWMAKVAKGNLLESLVGKTYDQPFTLGEDMDGVTGATYTSKAVAAAALAGSRNAARFLGLPVEQAAAPEIRFGLPEITILALFAVGFIAHRQNFKYKKQARWASMLTGMVVLGFIYSIPLTLAYIVKLILGYWPQWQNNLYFYFLTGGILFVLLMDKKNPYCDWFCPFGAAQECLGLIGGAKMRKPARFQEGLKWLQRLLALTALLLGIYFRSPGLASFEIFGTLFKLVGTSLQFAALGLVILASLFIARPWCNYLCPIRPVTDWIRLIRDWVKELWQKLLKKPRALHQKTTS